MIETNAFESERKMELVQARQNLLLERAGLFARIKDMDGELLALEADIRGIYDKRHDDEFLASGYPKTDSPLDYQPTLPGFGQVPQGIIRGFKSKLISWRNVG